MLSSGTVDYVSAVCFSVRIDSSKLMVAHRSTTWIWVGPQKNEAISGCPRFRLGLLDAEQAHGLLRYSITENGVTLLTSDTVQGVHRCKPHLCQRVFRKVSK